MFRLLFSSASHRLIQFYFDVNPNEMLNLAGWPALKVFSVQTENAEHLPPEAMEAALKISRIKKQSVRQKVAKAISTLAEQYLELEEALQ